MSSNPNFPQYLAIYPSVAPDSVQDGTKFGISDQQKSIEKYGIAGRVWEAAYDMDLYVRGPTGWEFEPPFSSTWQSGPCTVLELGSGTGIVGSRIADTFVRPGKDLVIVTDLPDVCPLLEANLDDQLRSDIQSGDGVVIVRPLAWGDLEHISNLASELSMANNLHSRPLTHIVCSDLVYFPELFAPLLRTLIQLTSPSFIPLAPELVVLMAYKIRSLTKESSFWSAFGLWFSFEPITMKPPTTGDHLPESAVWFAPSDTYVFIARRRPASYTWTVPQTDEDLMNGVGAYNTDVAKGDDTFETLLIMTIQDFVVA